MPRLRSCSRPFDTTRNIDLTMSLQFMNLKDLSLLESIMFRISSVNERDMKLISEKSRMTESVLLSITEYSIFALALEKRSLPNMLKS